jgi:integrase
MSKSHITKLYQDLKFIFEKAKKNKYIFDNPAEDLVLPKGSVKKRRSITEEERKHFLSVSENDNRFMLFLLMLYCGCRPSEAIRCVGDDISIMDGVPMLHIRGTKTEYSDRFVPIPDILYDRISATEKDSPVSPNEAGKHHDASSYKRLYNRLRRELNISMGCKVYRNALVEPYPLDPDFIPYYFRHTYCTDLQRAGVDVRIAQRLMGHASIEITANIYTHVDIRDIINVSQQINDKI